MHYLALPENVNSVATWQRHPDRACGCRLQEHAGDLTPYFEKVESYRTFPYFDRVYLPSGMWDTMCVTGVGLLADSMTVSQAADEMKNTYSTLMAK